MTEKQQVKHAVDVIQAGGVITYPTESVFGLGCDPFNKQAVMDLLHIKQRDVEKGLILVASHVQQILPLIMPKSGKDLARALKTWPGHHTWVFPKSSLVPAWISGTHASIAIRVSKHPCIVELCNMLNNPLVSTSANISEQDVLLSIKDLKTTFGDKIPCFLDAPLGCEQTTSSMHDAHTLKIIR